MRKLGLVVFLLVLMIVALPVSAQSGGRYYLFQDSGINWTVSAYCEGEDLHFDATWAAPEVLNVISLNSSTGDFPSIVSGASYVNFIFAGPVISADLTYHFGVAGDIRTGWVSCPPPQSLPHLADGRLNAYDIAAPVAIYPGSVEVYAIDPDTGEGEFSFRVSDDEIDAAGIPANGAIILGEAVHPFTGELITIYRLSSGEFQLNTPDFEGNPYVFLWE